MRQSASSLVSCGCTAHPSTGGLRAPEPEMEPRSHCKTPAVGLCSDLAPPVACSFCGAVH